MKRIIFLFVFGIMSLASFGQETGSDEVNPTKFASWTISECFQAEAGFAGSYWKPTFNIAVDNDGYYLVVNLYNRDGYYSMDSEALPHLYFKTDKNEVVDLEFDGDEPFHKIYLKGYYVAKVWMPGRYCTRLIYYIPNIEEFLSHYYVKYRVWLGESFKDVELSQSYANKFNKRLVNAYNQATKRFNAKSTSLNKPLEGF